VCIVMCVVRHVALVGMGLPGKKVTCIFSFVKIEDFTGTCSCLEEDVCTYINTIAKIVHRNCVLYNGAPNKNIGGGFLIVWKLDEDKEKDKPNDAVEPQSPPAARNRERSGINFNDSVSPNTKQAQALQHLADWSLSAMIKIIVDMYHANRDGTFVQFKTKPAMIERFGEDFEVRSHCLSH
jgi:hypothetical protein